MTAIDWDVMSAPWLRAEAGLEAAHETVVNGIFRRANLKAGQRVLDVGCGAGASLLPAAKAVTQTGYVRGVDIAPPFVARAKERVPAHVDVVVGDAGSFEHDEQFDAVISSFGTMFFADTPAAFANIRKAVAPGATFVFSAWGPPQQNPWFSLPRGAVEAHVGALPKPDPAGPGPFRFAKADDTIKALKPAGWDVVVDTEALTLKTRQNPAELADLHAGLVSNMLLANHDTTDADREAIKKNLNDAFSGLDGGDAIEVPAVIHFFMATAI